MRSLNSLEDATERGGLGGWVSLAVCGDAIHSLLDG